MSSTEKANDTQTSQEQKEKNPETTIDKTVDAETKENKEMETKEVEVKSVEKSTETEEETKADDVSSKDAPKSKENDSDEDSESEEEREREIEERKKLHADRKKHEERMRKILFILIGIEMVICSILMSPPPGIEIKADNNNYFKSRIFNYRQDTIDIVMVSMLRILCLYTFVSFAVTWGNVKTYDSEKEKHTIFNTQASHYKIITKIKGAAAFILLQAWNRVVGSNQSASVDNDDYSSLLLPKQNKDDKSTDDTVPVMDEKKKIRKIFDLQEFFDKYSGMNAQDVADVWKSVIWMTLFFVLTIFQTFVGIKISFFQCNTSSNYDYYYYIILFVGIISLTHLETYFAKKYIDDCCEPDNCYSDTRIHPHPIFKIKNKGGIYTYCQLCSSVPDRKTKKGKFTFKCHVCPRHRSFVCVKCWEKKRKEYRLKEEKHKKDGESGEVEIDPEDKDVDFKEYFVTISKYHAPYIHILLVGVIAMGLSSIINVFVPRQNGRLLDRLISGEFDGFYYAIKIQIFLQVSSSIIGAISSNAMTRVSKNIAGDLRKKLFANLMFQDMEFFDKHTQNDISRRMNWGLDEMLRPYQSTISIILSNFVSIIGALYMCLTISWRLTFLGLSTLAPMSYLQRLFSESERERWYLQWQLKYEMQNITYHGFGNIRTVRSFVKEHELVRHYNLLQQESHDADNKNKIMQSASRIVNGWFRLGTKILLTYMAGMIILNNKSDEYINYKTSLTVGLFVTFQTYWYQLYGTLETVGRTWKSYDQAFFTAKKIFRTLAKKPKIEHALIDNNDNDKKEETTNLINEIDGNIKFEDVEFFYESEPNKLVLKGINMEIERGKTTALVGRSGGGKSTMMHLMLRFYDPSKGKISINNVDLKEYNPYSLRRNIALVSQDTELFYKSMEYNIGYGANKLINADKNEYGSHYNLEQVEYCAKLANAHKFISDMDEKYDTKMGSRANRCSGGQKQRISIARMLMSKPNVMLLDEATSSLDAESEALVQAAMERESEEKNCTLVIVAHRLSTVVNADKICVIDDGIVVEQGNHEELIDKKGIYASLVERQLNLKTKMKKKLDKIKNGEEIKEGGDGQEKDDDDDYDNIDKLIDQIKAEKAAKKKEKEEKKKEKEENVVIEEEEADETEQQQSVDTKVGKSEKMDNKKEKNKIIKQECEEIKT